MAKKQSSQPKTQVTSVDKYRIHKKQHYIYHEVTPKGGVIYRLVKGKSDSPYSYNLAPGHEYAVIRVNAGIHSTLTVHKIRIAETDSKDDGIDPPPVSECCCGPGFTIVNPCPPGFTMDCSIAGQTQCLAHGEKRGAKK
jgi:hypothetical protein